jgi:putative FmdB family regulatory protein
MPLYEYYCPPCASQFETLRPISQMDAPAVCPEGHITTNRVLSLFAAFTTGEDGTPIPVVADDHAGAHGCGCGDAFCC